MVKYLKGKPS